MCLNTARESEESDEEAKVCRYRLNQERMAQFTAREESDEHLEVHGRFLGEGEGDVGEVD